MSVPVPTAVCGPYEIVALAEGTLLQRADGTLQLGAEERYLVRLSGEADPNVLQRALSVPAGGSEGTLRFTNFVGIAKLGPRRLVVDSDRLDSNAVTRMLDEVCNQIASLPFAPGTPTKAEYRRVLDPGPEVLYHSFAFLRDCMRGLGKHNLPSALRQILSRPHLSFRLGDAMPIPLGATSRFDAETVAAVQSEPELLCPVSRSSPLASHPLTRALKGTMPELVKTRQSRPSSDNAVNRFVVGALTTMIDLLRRFERLAAVDGGVAAAANATEAGELADALERFQRQGALARLTPSFEPPLGSTVLRGQPGYRQLLAVYTELLDHASRAEPGDAEALLELRDAATIYEYWSFFRIAAALAANVGPPQEAERFVVETMSSRVPYGYTLRWPEATLSYNRTFSPSPEAGSWPGSTSYSLSLRPDVSLCLSSGALHVFDPKLKLKGQGGFKSEDLHKMHAYRDALGADSAWVVYPGAAADEKRFAIPSDEEEGGGFRGVGALPLRPGEDDGTLMALAAELLAKP